MKLTYWVATRQDDSPAYSIRARTRRECIERVKAAHASGLSRDSFSAPEKVSIEYADAFDLAVKMMQSPYGK